MNTIAESKMTVCYVTIVNRLPLHIRICNQVPQHGKWDYHARPAVHIRGEESVTATCSSKTAIRFLRIFLTFSPGHSRLAGPRGTLNYQLELPCAQSTANRLPLAPTIFQISFGGHGSSTDGGKARVFSPLHNLFKVDQSKKVQRGQSHRTFQGIKIYAKQV